MNREDDFVWPGFLLLGIGLAGAAAYWGPSKVRNLALRLIPAAPLSRRREKILAIVSGVVPSAFGDGRFERMAPTYKPVDPDRPAGYTTCGELPRYVWSELGVSDGLTRGGLEQARTAAKAQGAWIEPSDGRRPRPGDTYGVSDTPTGIITHIGIVIDASGPNWRTADAGQGPRDAQAAAYVERPYDSRSNMLASPIPGRAPRYVAGWIDADRVQIQNERA